MDKYPETRILKMLIIIGLCVGAVLSGAFTVVILIAWTTGDLIITT